MGVLSMGMIWVIRILWSGPHGMVGHHVPKHVVLGNKNESDPVLLYAVPKMMVFKPNRVILAWIVLQIMDHGVFGQIVASPVVTEQIHEAESVTKIVTKLCHRMICINQEPATRANVLQNHQNGVIGHLAAKHVVKDKEK